MRKILSAVLVVLLMATMVSAVSVGDNLNFDNVKVNNQDATLYTQAQVDAIASVDDLDAVAVDEGEILDIDVVLEATKTAKDVQVEAEIRGYEYSDYDDLDDRTSTFDMEVSGTGKTTKRQSLEIALPKKLDKDRYLLRLTVDDKDSAALIRYVVLQIEPQRHGVDIADVHFSPGSTVKAGRSLLVTVLLENFGDKTEKDVKVTVAAPELGVSATEVVDVLKTDNHNIDYEDVPEMFLPIPATAAPGDYVVTVTAKFDDLRKTVSETMTVTVVENEMFQESDKLVLAIGPESQNVAAGQAAIYGVALTNAGKTSKAYNLETVTGDWATATLSDNLVVLSPGQNKVVYVEVTPKAGTAVGDHLASVTIKSGSDVLETVTLKVTVVEGGKTSGNFSLRNGLEIALIVLVVLLVIIGLIIGFSRLRKDDEDEDEQTYY